MYIADLHCDTISKIYNSKKQGKQTGLFKNSFQVDIQKMKKSNYMLQNFAIYVDLKNDENPYLCAKNQLAVFQNEMGDNAKWICQAKNAADIIRNHKEGKISAILTLEEGDICQGDVEKLIEFYEAGVRMMTFTWNYENTLGTKKGLTKKGVFFLEKMEELGILPDVSHLSEAGFYDVYRYSKGPFAASHSSAYSLCTHERNLKDDMIRKIAERGGVIGVNFYGLFLEETPEDGVYYSRVSRIADHILHMISVGGIACVALGADFDGMDDRLEISDCSKMDLLVRELQKRGLRMAEIEAIMYRNIWNLYREVF